MGIAAQSFTACAAFCASMASAQDVALQCRGTTPEWSLNISGGQAAFTYIGTATMDIPQSSRAEGRAWPLAMTLISADYSSTAIVLLHDRACNLGQDIIYDHEVQVLTQRNEQPVLLSGCCRDIS